jgi:uncharacterized protein
MDLHAGHADVMERALYNNVLAGLALDGRTFFYVNPLEVVPAVAKRRFECHLVKTQRVPWFGCACCPPNLARMLASLGDYAFGLTGDGLAVHLYLGGSIRFQAGKVPVTLQVTTEYPWQERVEIVVSATSPATFTLHLRLPGWCRAPHLSLNGQPVEMERVQGYARLQRTWQPGDKLVLDLPMPVERVHADARVAAAAGQVALQRGPVVYCVEQVDNGAELSALSLPRANPLKAHYVADLLGGCVIIEGQAVRTEPGGALYGTEPLRTSSVRLCAVPYALWANRGEGEMRVWLRES